MTHSNFYELDIFAIGGGEVNTNHPTDTQPSTEVLDRYILDYVRSKNNTYTPNVGFIGTASGDSQGYYQGFKNVYERLGARVHRLAGIALAGSLEELDMVYVGGGNTSRLLQTWHETGFDVELLAAAQNGLVLAGLSAGAICWFDQFVSDSPTYNETPTGFDRTPEGAPRKYTLLRGLGWLSGTVSPHNIREPERQGFIDALPNPSAVTRIDDGAAIHFTPNSEPQDVSVDPHGYTVYWGQ